MLPFGFELMGQGVCVCVLIIDAEAMKDTHTQTLHRFEDEQTLSDVRGGHQSCAQFNQTRSRTLSIVAGWTRMAMAMAMMMR